MLGDTNMSEEQQNNIDDDENQTTTPTATDPVEPQDNEGGISSGSESGHQDTTDDFNTEESSDASDSSNTSDSSSEDESAESEALPHYNQSPNTIRTKIACNGIDADTVEKLKAMDIDRRWQCDNRIPTWKWGLVNMAYDFNFIHKGGIVNDTDDRLLKIEGDVDTEDGAIRQQIGTRDIKYNGQGLQIDTSRETEEGESSSSN